MKNFLLKIKIETIWRMQFLFFLIKNGVHQKNISQRAIVTTSEKFLLYSCSGSCIDAQMANYVALQLNRKGIVEISPINCVGNTEKQMVRKALSGRKLIVLDGCSLACAKTCMDIHSIEPNEYFELSRFGVKTKEHQVFNIEEANEVFNKIEAIVSKKMSNYFSNN
jgi:uncharacterized metal-binding protein